MLPVRLGVVTALAALCLWGLFSLLDSLQEPGLLRSAKAIVVKGCDAIESDEARTRCPELLCQKALLDSKQVGWETRFEVDAHRTLSASERVIAGRGIFVQAGASPVYFRCSIADGKVHEAKLIDANELQALASPGDRG